MSEDEKLRKWEDVEDDVNQHLQNEEAPLTDEQLTSDDRSVFDPASSLTEQDQQTRALHSIQRALHNKSGQEAIKTLRSAR